MSNQANIDFPILSRLDFFNHAGVAPISAAGGKALRDYADQAERQAYVDSGWYQHIDEVRRLAAELIRAPNGREIAFVPNTTSGLAMVANGLEFHSGDQIVITSVEYPANRYPWEDLVKRFGVELVEVAPRGDGRIDVEDVIEAMTDHTRVVSVSHVQYGSGFRIELRPLADMVHRVGGYLCVDAIQSAGVVPVDVSRDGADIDFLSADGHKWMLGPEGCGLFYCRKELVELLHPTVVGWMNMVNANDYGNYCFELLPDARRFEPGSHNIPGIMSLGASLRMLLDVGIEQVWSRVESLNAQLCEGCTRRGYQVYSPRDHERERSGIVCFTHRDPSRHRAIMKDLERRGIIIALREGRLRVSAHFYNTADQIDRLLASLPVCG